MKNICNIIVGFFVVFAINTSCFGAFGNHTIKGLTIPKDQYIALAKEIQDNGVEYEKIRGIVLSKEDYCNDAFEQIVGQNTPEKITQWKECRKNLGKDKEKDKEIEELKKKLEEKVEKEAREAKEKVEKEAREAKEKVEKEAREAKEKAEKEKAEKEKA